MEAHFYINNYPEILWLADEKVCHTEEEKASLSNSYSEKIFGKKFIEFDRTLMALHCLRLILDGSNQSYQQFSKDQPQDSKLTKHSFHQLHKQGISLLKALPHMTEVEVLQAIQVSLILGDMGKSEIAREIFKPFGAKAPDHDDFNEEALHILQKYPEISPTFNRLSLLEKKLLIDTVNLIHYGHVTHLEGGPSMFSRLRGSHLLINHPNFLSFDFFVHICDVAGALGHVNNQSSLVYTERCHLAMQAVLEACKVLIHPNKTEIDAYNSYLAIRAHLLDFNRYGPFERLLTRLGAMFRLFTPGEGRVLKDALLQLPSYNRVQITEAFEAYETIKKTPTYMPAILVNLASNLALGPSKEERLSQAAIIGVPLIAKVLNIHREHLLSFKADPTIPLNFNKIAGIAKTYPYHLMKGEYTIDSEGCVCLC